MYRLYL